MFATTIVCIFTVNLLSALCSWFQYKNSKYGTQKQQRLSTK